MSALLLDTHVWIWFLNGAKELSSNKQTLISAALHSNQAYIAAISLWEIAMLEKKERIILGMPCLEWLNQSIALTRMQVLPLTPEIAAESVSLPGKFHGDPADSIIVATARIEGCTLLTRDKKILAYSHYKYITVNKV